MTRARLGLERHDTGPYSEPGTIMSAGAKLKRGDGPRGYVCDEISMGTVHHKFTLHAGEATHGCTWPRMTAHGRVRVPAMLGSLCDGAPAQYLGGNAPRNAVCQAREDPDGGVV